MKKFIGLIVTAITSIVLYGFSAQKYKGSLGLISLENKRQGAVVSAWEYGYDRLGSLTEEDYSGWKQSLYEYDACSN